tara:strand:- start:733 stop:1098 length:366 start_codon:yes stop_codon:yes gene_type:complete
MAEGIARALFPKNIIVESAGTEAHGLNPIAMQVMDDISISISKHKSTKISDKKINKFDILITLCGDARDKCPILDSGIKHIHWGVEDPAVFKGDKDETYMKYQEVRDIIFKKISDFKEELE